MQLYYRQAYALSRGAVKNNSAPRPGSAQLLPLAAAAMSRKKRCSTSLFPAKFLLATRGLTARGREKTGHILSKPQRRSNGPTTRGREKTVRLLSKPKDGATAIPRVDAKKTGRFSEESPCCNQTHKKQESCVNH